jgi:hypothetical protein
MFRQKLIFVVFVAGLFGARAGYKPATKAEEKEMLDLHNKYRCMAGVDPLVWDEKLAKQATDWAALGKVAHSIERGCGTKYGENMHMSYPKETPKKATDWWYDEIKKYHGPSDVMAAGHYTQMVWKGSKKLGCGKGILHMGGMTGAIWFCQFTPPGNYADKAKDNVIAPTKSASACGGSSLYDFEDDFEDDLSSVQVASPSASFAQTFAWGVAGFAVTAVVGVAAFAIRQRASRQSGRDQEELLRARTDEAIE